MEYYIVKIEENDVYYVGPFNSKESAVEYRSSRKTAREQQRVGFEGGPNPFGAPETEPAAEEEVSDVVGDKKIIAVDAEFLSRTPEVVSPENANSRRRTVAQALEEHPPVQEVDELEFDVPRTKREQRLKDSLTLQMQDLDRQEEAQEQAVKDRQKMVEDRRARKQARENPDVDAQANVEGRNNSGMDDQGESRETQRADRARVRSLEEKAGETNEAQAVKRETKRAASVKANDARKVEASQGKVEPTKS